MEGNLVSVGYNGLLAQGCHHRTHNEIVPKRLGTAVVCGGRPAELNEAPEVNRRSRAPDKKQRIERRDVVPLQGEFDDCGCCAFSGLKQVDDLSIRRTGRLPAPFCAFFGVPDASLALANG